MRYFGFDESSFELRTLGFDFSPLNLFKGGKQGVWFDPSDLTTLFQDAAGTVPVTASGDPVGMMKDKSGNGNHATQTVSAARPTYQTNGNLHWLGFDGADDFLDMSVSLSGSSNVAIGFLSSLTGGFALGGVARPTASQAAKIGVVQSGSIFYRAVNSQASIISSVDESKGIVSTLSRHSGALIARTNGRESTGVDTPALASNWTAIGYGNYAGQHLAGKVYSLITVDSYNKADADNAEGYVAKKAGVTL